METTWGPARPGDTLLFLAWNGQVIVIAIEGIVAHGQGGNQGKLLVL